MQADQDHACGGRDPYVLNPGVVRTPICCLMKKELIKNLPLLSNLLANCAGVFIIHLVQGDMIQQLFPLFGDKILSVEILYEPLAIVLCVVAALRFERPVRQVLDYSDVQEVPAPILTKARKRLLSIPYFYICINLLAWILAALLFPLVLVFEGAAGILVALTAAQCLIIGITTCAMAFFLVEALLQTCFMPRIFPKGGVFDVQGVPRTRIITRLVALFAIAGFVPGVVSLLIAGSVQRMLVATRLDPAEVIQLFSSALSTNALVFIATGLSLAILVAFTLAYPFRDIVAALHDIRQGRLKVWIPVRSTDEVGYTCEAINRMAGGLRERKRLRRSLTLAGAVQQSLLPRHPPDTPGLDIAGVSIPCDETGGDFFDYIRLAQSDLGLGIVVGDVSGHGIPSALLMTTVRAMIRTRCDLPGSPCEMLADINRQLCRDVGDSGNFVTLFFLGFAGATRAITWVRAGQDPALLYTPETDSFHELMEGGPTLGVMAEAVYTNGYGHLASGQVILIGTDGIWESRSPTGEPFGKHRVRRAMRESAHLKAQEILDTLLAELTTFRAGQPVEDDITAVVVKGVAWGNNR